MSSLKLSTLSRLACLLCLLLFALRAHAQAATSGNTTASHEFIYESATKLDSVAVAGTFNNWDRTTNPMVADAAGKTWRAKLRLPLGKHLYKFVVNGGTWVADPKSRQEGDYGNSVLLLTPPDYAQPASPQDGVIARSALLHLTSVPYLNYDRGRLTLSLRARPGDLRQVWLKVGRRRHAMTVISTDELYARYFAQVIWDRKHDLAYTFELSDGPKVLAVGANGVGTPDQVQPFHLSARQFTPFKVPDWVERSVIYQIFPDRFANGDKGNDPPNVQPWDAKPSGNSRFGGDAQGVRQHLPYLRDLGVSAVYFNPVFKSPSNHRYDTTDYHQVDAEFGTNADFTALTKELQAQHMRTVMDFVFNHSAANFAPFLDVREKGAASAYKDWYFIRSFPVHAAQPPNYDTFGNWWGMPKLNMANPQTSDYMLNVVNYWKAQVPLAGLRLDVADAVDTRFWRRFRQRVKGLDPQMWIVGETWGDGSPWLTGDQWDSKMNYEFLWPCRDFFADGKITPTEYMRRLMETYSKYAPQVSRNMMNLLSSHDTVRFLTLCQNNQDLHRLAATVQFTWVGAPSVYYGEELGMEGGNDPDNRRGMAWNRAMPDNLMLHYYQRLIRMRNASKALQSGDPQILMANDTARTLAYARSFGSDMAIVALNRSDNQQTLNIPLPQNVPAEIRRMGLGDGLTGQHFAVGGANSLHITLAPLRAAVLLPATPTFLAVTAQQRKPPSVTATR